LEIQQPLNWEEGMKEGKSYKISQHQVFEAYKLVKANKGAPGIDGMSFEEYEKNLKNNLYKLWNRMSSGTYFPKAVKGKEIPKKNGKVRLLGIPTIEDRIAQKVIQMNLEPELEQIFCEDSYGYRPNKSMTDAIGVVRERCWKMPWVIELDIVGLFDNIDHELLMQVVKKHAKEKWIILYVERALKADIVMPNGEIKKRAAGTPQGGVCSALLSNLFMHYAFDRWMETQLPETPWVRYADDVVIHCNSKQEAEIILQRLIKRMRTCKLELHPEKTKIVYCRSDNNNRFRHENESFDFLGYTFKARLCKRKDGRLIMGFTPAVSDDNLRKFRDKMRQMRKTHIISTPEEFAEALNPIIRGWANYFTKYTKSHAVAKGLRYVNLMLVSWARRRYKRLNKSNKQAYLWVCKLGRQSPDLFHHWRIGVRPATGL